MKCLQFFVDHTRCTKIRTNECPKPISPFLETAEAVSVWCRFTRHAINRVALVDGFIMPG